MNGLNNATGGETSAPSSVLVKITDNSNTIACVFCKKAELDEMNYGPMYSRDGVACHYFCMLFSSGLTQGGRNDTEGIQGFLPSDILKEARRGNRLKCTFCNQPGASIGCCKKRCKVMHHFPCGLTNEIQYQFLKNYETYCPIHSDKLALPEGDLNCTVCMSTIDKDEQPVQGNCCNGAVFHKYCIQRMALNSGYFMKCPLCNGTKGFVDNIRRQGIFVPEQDASWEAGNEFDDLLFQYSRCDAKVCSCPNGREFNAETGSFELARCCACGASAIHKRCGKLKSVDSWECQPCSVVTQKVDLAKADTTPSLRIPIATSPSSYRVITRTRGIHPQNTVNITKIRIKNSTRDFFPQTRKDLRQLQRNKVQVIPDHRGFVVRVHVVNWLGRYVNQMLGHGVKIPDTGSTHVPVPAAAMEQSSITDYFKPIHTISRKPGGIVKKRKSRMSAKRKRKTTTSKPRIKKTITKTMSSVAVAGSDVQDTNSLPSNASDLFSDQLLTITPMEVEGEITNKFVGDDDNTNVEIEMDSVSPASENENSNSYAEDGMSGMKCSNLSHELSSGMGIS